jgi:hypothetical protein
MRLTVYYFIFSMIPTFRRVVKRQHHICYHSEIDDILEYLSEPNLERGAIAKISRDMGIPDGTLCDWHRHRVGEENWFPLADDHPRVRALNPESEAAIPDFIRDNYIHRGIGATQTHLKHLCLDSYAAQDDYECHLERFYVLPTLLCDQESRQGPACEFHTKNKEHPLTKSKSHTFSPG